MKVHATIIPYSGTVGGGLMLTDEKGRAYFIVAIIGTTKGISKEQTAAISKALINGIKEPFEVPDRD
jgi:hypothetical protein